jgi:hypothetical protein
MPWETSPGTKQFVASKIVSLANPLLVLFPKLLLRSMP